MKPMRSMQRQPLTQGAAQGEAAEISPFDLEIIEHRQRIRGQLLDRVRRGRCTGFAVAARIVADDMEFPGEGRNLTIPKRQIAAYGMRQHDRRLARVARRLDMDEDPGSSF